MENQQNLFDLQIDAEVTDYLQQSARWAKFVSIVGFVFCGFFVLFALFAGTMLTTLPATGGMGAMNALPGAFITVIYLIVAALMFIPYYLQYKFAGNMQAALRSGDQQALTSSFSSLKSYFKYMGILMIISIACFVLMFIFGIVAALVGANMA